MQATVFVCELMSFFCKTAPKLFVKCASSHAPCTPCIPCTPGTPCTPPEIAQAAQSPPCRRHHHRRHPHHHCCPQHAPAAITKERHVCWFQRMSLMYASAAKRAWLTRVTCAYIMLQTKTFDYQHVSDILVFILYSTRGCKSAQQPRPRVKSWAHY